MVFANAFTPPIRVEQPLACPFYCPQEESFFLRLVLFQHIDTHFFPLMFVVR